MTVQQIFDNLYLKLSHIAPEGELRLKAEIAYEILRLKKEKDVVILGHNYMEPALYHSITDFVGDSLELCRKAATTDKSIILFCGVKFMAETAKILNPGKTVLLPSEKAGCSLAAGITAEDVRNLKRRFPGIPVITYINTYADVKAECDICCTSGNAAEVVRSFGDQTVIFLPDEYLARNTASETGRKIFIPEAHETEKTLLLPPGSMIAWKARCEVHELFTLEDIRNVRKQLPEVTVIAHPECSPEVVQASDFSGSTSAMIRYLETAQLKQYLLLTECSMGDNIAASFPDKELIRLCSVRCQHMNQITLEDTLESLRRHQFVIDLPSEIQRRAYNAVAKMLTIRHGRRD